MNRSILKTAVAAAALFCATLAVAQSIAVRDLQPIYVNGELDLARFDSVLIDRLGIDDAFVLPPPWYEGADRSPKKWSLTDDDVAWARKSYRAAMTDQIAGNNGYPIAAGHGDNVLVVDIAIIYLMPYARRDENVQTSAFGEVLVQAQLRDGANGELLAIFEGKQEVGSTYQQNTRLNNENRLSELFEYWGMRVRGILDDSHAK